MALTAERASVEAAEASASLGLVAAEAATAVGMRAERDRPAWDRAFEARKRAALQLERLEQELTAAVEAHAAATRELARRQSALDHAREAESLAAQASKAAAKALTASVAAWSPSLLSIDVDSVLAALESWLDDPCGRSPVEEAIAEAERGAIGAVEGEKAARGVERNAAVEERKLAVAERERLKRGGHAPPTPSPTRLREPARRGAPLWALVDFREDLPDAARRGLEAALEAAGLLDAWVTPSGAVLPSGTLDAAITLEAPALSRSLGDVLVPVDHAGVSNEVVAAILQRIGLGLGAVWVDEHGNYALGPVRGSWSKSEAEHIGETAREVKRARLIAELALRIEGLDSTVTALDEALRLLAVKATAIRAEARSRPDDGPVKQAALELTHRREAATKAQNLLVEAETVRLSRRETEAAKRGARDGLAHDLQFQRWIGNPRGLEQALARADRGAVEHFGALRRLVDTEAALGREHAALADAVADLGRATQGTADAARARRDAEVRCQTLEGAHGAEVASILADIEQARKDAGAGSKRREAAQSLHLAATRQDASAEAALTAATERCGGAETERDGHVGSVVSLLDAGLLGVLAVAVPEGLGSTTRVVELARRLEALLDGVAMDDHAWARVQDALHRDLEELRRSLLDHRWDPVLRSIDDLAVVEVSLGDTPLRVPDLKDRLEGEVRSRAAMLTAREREVIENHLVGELANELHNLIHLGETLVREMSKEVESRATSTGMRLRFDWRLRDDAGEAVADARRRLMRQGASWSQADRDLIARFLKDRLDTVRAEDAGATWQQQIERAFDYREWHGFIVERHQDGQWKQLTRRTHGTGSGGEKAIALTIPQLAAAAAYYRNADSNAPRLILLDEAFVGVDSDMRGKCMGLFASFDLDFVMTSEREWGCYASLPGVAICQLATQPGVDAIDVVRWVWNGRERRQT